MLADVLRRIALGATIKSIQRGTTTLTSDTQDVNITAVDLTKSLIIIETSQGNDGTANAWCSVRFLDADTIRFHQQDGDSDPNTVEWTVVEFTSGVTVHSGDPTFATGSATGSHTLSTAVDPDKSFVITSYSATSGSSFNEGYSKVRTKLNSGGTALDFARGNSGGPSMYVPYFVVEFD